MPNSEAEQVQFKSPTTGVLKALGRENWEEALSRGYKPVDHTVLYSPDGKRGMVPNEQLRDYVQQGYETTPKTQFEKDRPGAGQNFWQEAGKSAWNTAKRFLGGAVEQIDPTRGLSGAGLTALGVNPRSGTTGERLSEIPIVGAAHETTAAHRDKTAAPWEVPVAGAGSLFGVSAERAREHAARGEAGQIAGEAAIPATIAAAPLVGEAVRRFRGSAPRTGDAPRTLTMPEPKPEIPPAPRPSFNGPKAPPPVSPRFATEAVGSVTDPMRLGPRGQGGVVVPQPPQPKLLPESVGRFVGPAQDNAVSSTNSFKLTPPAEVREPAVQNAIGFPRTEPAPKIPSAASMKNAPFPKAEPTRFAGPKPSANKLAEAIANNVLNVEPPPKAPFGQALRTIPKATGETVRFPKAPEEHSSPFENKAKEDRQDFYSKLGRDGLDVGNVDLRQALINAGEDMGDRIVSDRKLQGPGAMERREAIKILHDKGYTPEQIAKMGKERSAVALK